MAILTEELVKRIVEEINGMAEKTRRAEMHRRHKLYLDGGKQYLIEQLGREFNEDAVREMRLAPINLLKKIVNKKSTIYKEAPFRKANSTSNQALVDFYTQKLKMDQVMMKGHRYYNLFANCAIYTRPNEYGVSTKIVPPYLYSVVANPMDQTKIESFIFSDFTEEGQIIPYFDIGSATGSEGFSRSRLAKSAKDLVASDETPEIDDRNFIFWTPDEHFTSDVNGSRLAESETEQDYTNPIGMMPIVNLAQDRDNTPWAMQGGDQIDICLVAQLAMSDILSIAKHQGFSLLSIISEEEPRNLKIGLNRAIWLKATNDAPVPSIQYVQAQSPLDQYNKVVQDLIGLLLTTNDMSVNAIGGSASAKNITSGFQALIEMSDTLEVVEQQKPILKQAEKDAWMHIAAWHNWLYDMNALEPEDRALGRFSDDFEIEISYRDAKPIESEQEKVATVKDLRALKLLTRKDAVRKLNPDLSDDQVDEKLKELDDEFGDTSNEDLLKGITDIQNKDNEDQLAKLQAVMNSSDSSDAEIKAAEEMMAKLDEQQMQEDEKAKSEADKMLN